MSELLILGLHTCNMDVAELRALRQRCLECWTLNDFYMHYAAQTLRPDRVFMMHPQERYDKPAPARFRNWRSELNASGALVMAQHLLTGLNRLAMYPMEQVVELCGKNVLTSTVPYMFALAMLEGWRKVSIRGMSELNVDPYRRSAAAHCVLIDRMRASGMEVDAPMHESWKATSLSVGGVDWARLPEVYLRYGEVGQTVYMTDLLNDPGVASLKIEMCKACPLASDIKLHIDGEARP